MKKMILRLWITLLASAIMSQSANAATIDSQEVSGTKPVCEIALGNNGKAKAILNKDPGGDKAIHIYVNSKENTYFAKQGQWFNVGGDYRKDVVRGYSSQLVLHCSN